MDYYFGDLPYWKLPKIAADALERGLEGPALRRLAGLADRSARELIEEDLRREDIDLAFREMGIDAPITKAEATLALAAKSARKALDGDSNVFDEATHIRIHLCGISDPPDALERIVILSREARNAQRPDWSRIEAELVTAFEDFLRHR